MPLSLLFAGSFPWRFIIFLGVMALLATVKLQHGRIQTMSQALEAARRAAEDQARVAERLQHDAERANKAVAKAVRQAEVARKEFSALRQEIYSNAPHDGPLAPVLRRTLDRLPNAPAASGRGDQ